MSIFISKEAKDKAQGYWFGLLSPLLAGWGVSTFSMTALMSRDGPVSEMTYVDYFFMTGWISGGLVVHPLCAWWVLLRAKIVGNAPCIKGAYMSIKLYILWIFFLLSMTIISFVWGE